MTETTFRMFVMEFVKEHPEWATAAIEATSWGVMENVRKARCMSSYVEVLLAQMPKKELNRIVGNSMKGKMGINPEGLIVLGLLRDNYPNWKELPSLAEIKKKGVKSEWL